LQHPSPLIVFKAKQKDAERDLQNSVPIILKAMTVKLNANEVVLKAGDTNQVIEGNTIEGKFIVTSQRIYFKALKEEMEKFNLEILFDNILEVIYFSKGIFSVKGLNVITRDGRCLSFPLKKRDEFGQLINKMY